MSQDQLDLMDTWQAGHGHHHPPKRSRMRGMLSRYVLPANDVATGASQALAMHMSSATSGRYNVRWQSYTNGQLPVIANPQPWRKHRNNRNAASLALDHLSQTFAIVPHHHLPPPPYYQLFRFHTMGHHHPVSQHQPSRLAPYKRRSNNQNQLKVSRAYSLYSGH